VIDFYADVVEMLRPPPTRIALTDDEVQACVERITLERALISEIISEIEQLDVGEPVDFEHDGPWCVSHPPSRHLSSGEISLSDDGCFIDRITQELSGKHDSESHAEVGQPPIEDPLARLLTVLAWTFDSDL
jgi:hypothetical protein